MQKLNQVELSFNFSYELKKNNSLPFQDILLINNNNKLEFKIDNQNDHIHFYSSTAIKQKAAFLIGFFLRAIRICSPKYLNEEFEHIHNSFSKLQYPNLSLTVPKQKPLISTNTHPTISIKNKPYSNTNSIKRHIFTPKSHYHPNWKKKKTILINHTFDFQNAVIFAFIHDKNERIIEACFIAHHNTIPVV